MNEHDESLPLIEDGESLPTIEQEGSLPMIEHEQSLPMKWYYLIGGAVLISVVLIVLFWPGLGDNIEGRLLGWLSRNAQ